MSIKGLYDSLSLFNCVVINKLLDSVSKSMLIKSRTISNIMKFL